MSPHITRGLAILFTLVFLTSPFYSVPLSLAVTTASVTGYTSPMVVGTPDDMELEFTIDTTELTWANDDYFYITLTSQELALNGWSDLDIAVEFDEDSTNNGVGETPINEGGIGSRGEYFIDEFVLNVYWDEDAWAADTGDTIRIEITDLVPQYDNDSATIVFDAFTAIEGTWPVDQVTIPVDPADADATVTLGDNATVGTAGDTTVEFTIPLDLDVYDYVLIEFPDQMDTSAVAYSSKTFAGAGDFECASLTSPQVRCDPTGAITAGEGEIILSGIYVTSDDSSNTYELDIYENGTWFMALDETVPTTNGVAADANASVTLGDNAVVGASGTTTVTLTIPVEVSSDTGVEIEIMSFPDFIDVSGATFSSETFGGVGTFSECSPSGQTIRCVVDGTISAGTGAIRLSGIVALSAGTEDVNEVLIYNEDDSSIADDLSVALTNSRVASSSGGGSTTAASNSTDDEEEETDDSSATEDSTSDSSESTENDTSETSEDSPFTDLDEDSPYFESVMHLYELGIITGYSDDTIRVMDTINRAELMTLLVRSLDAYVSSSESCFKDVNEEWFAEYVCYAYEQNWVDGYSDRSFKPGDAANTVEVIKMILNVNGVEVDDRESGESWYTPYVEVAQDLDLVSDNLNYSNEASRGFVFTFLSDLLTLIPNTP